jgi:hypothetical protein
VFGPGPTILGPTIRRDTNEEILVDQHINGLPPRGSSAIRLSDQGCNTTNQNSPQ